MQVELEQLCVQTTHAQQFNDMVDNMVQHVDTFSKDQLLKVMLNALTDISWGNVDVVDGESSTNSSVSDWILSVPGERFYDYYSQNAFRQVLDIKRQIPQYNSDNWEYGESEQGIQLDDRYVYSSDKRVRGKLYNPEWIY